MTCIVALKDNGNIYIGGDSAGVAGLSISIRNDEKVFQNGPFVFGFTSSFRMGQILRYKFYPPEQTPSQSDMKYMVTDFIDSVRQCFAANGFGDKDATVGGNFLVGYKGNLYNIQDDFQVGLPNVDFDAAGCGTDLALGSLYSTQGSNLSPEQRITVALEAASKFSAGVAPPFIILKQEYVLENEAKPKAKSKPKTKPRNKNRLK